MLVVVMFATSQGERGEQSRMDSFSVFTLS